jgi:hypothetical protein
MPILHQMNARMILTDNMSLYVLNVIQGTQFHLNPNITRRDSFVITVIMSG